MSDLLTIVIRLPQSVNDVAALFGFVGDHWPDADIDVDGPDGWTITVPPMEGA